MTIEQNVVSLGPQGRVLIPATFRQSLDLTQGERFVISVGDDETISLQRIRDRIADAEGLFKEYAPKEGLLSDELIEERRQEAATE